jgi:hypothetical protein
MSISSSIDLALNISRFDANTRAEVIKQLLEMEKELKKKLLHLYLTAYSRAKIEKLLSECETVIQAYYGNISSIVKGATDGVVGVVIKATAASLIAELPSALDVSLPTANMVKAIMSDAMVLGSPLSDWFDKQSSDAVFKFQSAIRQGLLQAETNQQIINRVKPIFDVNRRNTAALVQTAVQSVASAARMATYAENEDVIAGYTFYSTLDSHTCFPANTLVTTPLGQVEIKNIREGDYVIGGSGNSRKVLSTASSKRTKMARITLSNGQIITCTQDHLFMNNNGFWVKAIDLKENELMKMV